MHDIPVAQFIRNRTRQDRRLFANDLVLLDLCFRLLIFVCSMFQIAYCCMLCVSDCKFMIYPPSMIAAGSIGAAAHGLNNTITHVDLKLLEKLHHITGIEMVRMKFHCFYTCISYVGSIFYASHCLCMSLAVGGT